MLTNLRIIGIGRLSLAAGFALAIWSLCFLSLAQATKQLTDLTKLAGLLDSVIVERGTGRSEPYYIVFNLDGTQERPGINTGATKDAALRMATKFHRGENLIIYYDATAPKVERDVNLLVYQVQIKNKVVYSLADAYSGYWGEAIPLGILALLFTLAASVKFYRAIKEPQTAF